MKYEKMAKGGLLCWLGTALLPAAAIAFEMPQDSGAVNVKTYGARGDGKTDDTAAFQQALNANARSVYVPNGTSAILIMKFQLESGGRSNSSP
jgi:polygalacturonase